jgi:hypothetical protein
MTFELGIWFNKQVVALFHSLCENGSGNGLNMYLNPRVHGLISMKGKNSRSEVGREDREVQR